MDTETGMTAGGADAPALPVDNGGALSASDAAALFAANREKPKNDAVEAPEPREKARPDEPPARSASDEDDSGARPEGDDPAEPAAEGEDDPAERPSIEPPRSWSKEDKELFKSLPPETQERLAERERAREAEFRRGQNTIAEQRKAAEAEAKALAEQRSQYEQALPALLNSLSRQNNEEFADVRNWDDANKLAREDPFRFAAWQAHQGKIAAVKQEMAQAQVRQRQEAEQHFARYAEEQDRLFAEKAPEYADPKQAEKIQAEAAKYLTDQVGFSPEELAESWNGRRALSLRDARVQSLVRDALKWRMAEAKRAEVAAKPTPPVQKPGVAAPRSEAVARDVQSLDRRLSQTGSLKDAVELLAAKRRAASKG